MKKNVVVITIILAFVIFTYAVYALDIMPNFNNESSKKSEISKNVEGKRKDKRKPVVSVESIDDKLNDYIFENQILEALKEQGLEEDEIAIAMEEYARLVVTFNVSEYENEYILELLKNNSDLRQIIKIYRFLADSDIDMEVLEKMYDVGSKTKFVGDYWLENAFNIATNNRGGSLDGSEIADFLQKDITISDIKFANMLCMKGTLTIKEILDKKVEGISWNEIMTTVYKVDSADAENYKNETDPNVVINCIRWSKITQEKPGEIYKKTKGDPLGEFDNTMAEKHYKVREFLNDKKVLVDRNSEKAKRFKKKLIDRGYDENKIDTLMFKKYTMKNIEKAAEIVEETGEEIERVLELHEQTNEWAGIPKEGDAQ